MNYIFKPIALILLGAVSLSAAGAELARRGPLSATADDFYAFHYMNAPAKVEGLKASGKEVQSTISEVLAARTYNVTPGAHSKLDSVETRYYNLQLERAGLTAELNLRERRVRAAFKADDPLTLARARELWLTDTSRFYAEESADITQVFFDMVKRPFAETGERIKEAQAAIARGDNFDEVVAKYSDDTNLKDNAGKVKGISIVSAEAVMGNTIFKRLKEGEISTPTPTRAGLHIVRLDKKYARTKKAFDDVKAKIVEQLLEDAAKNARIELLESLNRTETVINETAFEDFVGKDDPSLDERRREIYRGLGITISAPLAKP
jgi:hypothetical protein